MSCANKPCPCPPHTTPAPAARFTHINVDLVGPLPPSAGHTYLFTIINRTAHWSEAIPLSSTSTADCAAALMHHWVARFSVPSHIISDRGPQFTSQLWTYLCEQLNIVHHPITAYYLQSNGLVERFHRHLKDMLRPRAATVDWYHHLPWVLLSFRTTPAEESAISPAQAVRIWSPATAPYAATHC